MYILKVLYKYKATRCMYTVAAAFVVVSSVMKAISPMYMKVFFNSMINGQFLINVVFVIFSLEVISTFLNFSSKSLSYRLKAVFIDEALREFSRKNLRLNMGRSEAAQATLYIRRITDNQMATQFGGFLGIIKALIFMVVSFKLDPVIGILISMYFFLSVMLMAINFRSYSKVYSEVLEKEAKLKSHTYDVLKGKEDIKLFCAQQQEFDRFRERSKELMRLQKKMFSVDFYYSDVLQRVINISFFFLLLLRGYALMDAGVMVAAARYFSLVSGERRSFLGAIDAVKQSNEAARKFIEFIS